MKVRNGRVQKKNRTDVFVRDCWDHRRGGALPIVVEGAVRGCRQVLSEDDLRRFFRIVPDWSTHAAGLRCVVLGDGSDDVFGWYDDGVILLDAWYAPVGKTEWYASFYEEHAHIVARLGVEPTVLDDGDVFLPFTREQAAAFLLMHVFLHELGHHVDAMRTRAKLKGPNGEPFAEQFANDLAEQLWTPFFRAFGW
jgi:hypothetical protein